MLAEAQKALSLNPREIDAKNWLSKYYAINGDYAPAKDLLYQILEEDPLFFPARMNLGEILRLEGDIDGAIREHSKVLEQDSRNQYATASLARAYTDRNDIPAARRTLEDLSPEGQKSFSIRLMWALVLALEGKTNEALAKMDEESQMYGTLAPLATSVVAGPQADTSQIAAGQRVRFTIPGYRGAHLDLIVAAISDPMGAADARDQFLGDRFKDGLPIAGQVVVVEAHLAAPTFSSDGRTYQLHDGMLGLAEVELESRSVLEALVPGR